MTTIKPVNIDVDRDANILRITWADNKVCAYPISHLRDACPCADCRGGHDFMGRSYDPEHILAVVPTAEHKLESAELVGNYALQFNWEDGHSAGIFTWEYLRNLCPPEA